MADIISQSHCQRIVQIKTSAIGKWQCRHKDDEMTGVGGRPAVNGTSCAAFGIFGPVTRWASIRSTISEPANLKGVSLDWAASSLCATRQRPPTTGGPRGYAQNHVAMHRPRRLKKLTIVRLVCGAGLDALHLLGLDDIVSNAEEDEKGRHQGSGAATASPQHRDHGTLLFGRFMARAIGGDGYRNPGYPLKNGKSPWVSVFDDIFHFEKMKERTERTPSGS